MSPSGREAALASHSATPGSSSEPQTQDTSGPSSSISSASAALQRSLANRLRQRLEGHGSPEYSLTLKAWPMPQREPIFALRASGARTSGSGSGGWGTPRVSDGTLSETTKMPPSGTRSRLELEVLMVGWNTPRATDGSNGGPNQTGGALPADASLSGWPTTGAGDEKWRINTAAAAARRVESGKQASLECIAMLSGWPTTTTRDHKDGDRDSCANVDTKSLLGRVATLSNVSTENRGALNPAHSRWLMGYPVEWDSCGAMAMQSFRKSPKSLSVPITMSDPMF